MLTVPAPACPACRFAGQWQHLIGNLGLEILQQIRRASDFKDGNAGLLCKVKRQ